jgi:predicted nuclease of predicted toxin-antitoxin system
MMEPPLRFLADENCDHAVVPGLRAAGHDVVALSEVASRSVDREVLDQAVREGRILITED